MPDTVRDLSALQALLADNVTGDISPQDVRDFLVSVYGASDIARVSLTGNVNDWNPAGLQDDGLLFVDADGDYDITGITAPDGTFRVDGRVLVLVNVDATNVITLPEQDAGSVAANRFDFGAILIPGQSVILAYDNTQARWTRWGGLTTHATAHQNGGADEITVAGLSGELADNQPPKAHAGNHVTGGGDTIADAVAAGNSGLMSGADKTKLDGLPMDYIKVSDVKANNTTGGNFASGAWRTRDINTEDSDAGGHATIAANQITLQPGTYVCFIRCPGERVTRHKARLQNITDGTTIILGANARADAGNDGENDSIVHGEFSLAVAKVLEIQHRCSITDANGFGNATSFGVSEIYTTAEFWRRTP